MLWNALFFLLFSTLTQREFWRYKPVLLSLYDERKKKSLDYLLLHTELQEKSSLGTVFTSQQPQISNFKQLYMSGFPLKGNERRCGEWQESNLELRWTFTVERELITEPMLLSLHKFTKTTKHHLCFDYLNFASYVIDSNNLSNDQGRFSPWEAHKFLGKPCQNTLGYMNNSMETSRSHWG